MALGWVITVLCGIALHAPSVQAGLHLAHRGLLQVHASFAGEGITLFPAHHPNHAIHSLDHVVPKTDHELYFSQEGHRPARHGAKHAAVKTKFSRPTIVLDHTDHLLSITCGDESINACFTPEAFQYAQKTWAEHEFNLVTYHVGCGDEVTGTRSVFHAKQAKFDAETSCVEVSTKPVTYKDAMESGEITWGTYKDPEKMHIPVKGHVRVSRPEAYSLDDHQDAFPRRIRSGKAPRFVPRQHQYVAVEGLLPPPPPHGVSRAGKSKMVDLENNATALINFFGLGNYGLGANFAQPVPVDQSLDPIQLDGTTPTEQQEGYGGTTKARAEIERRRAQRRGQLQSRWFGEGLWEGLEKLASAIADFIITTAKILATIVNTIEQITILSAKLIAVPFGVPFDESYHHDFEIAKDIKYSGGNRPPKIFEFTDGYNLAGTGGIFAVQCAKCGVHAKVSTEGRLAFSIKDGITEGYIAVHNEQNLTVDAIFGLTLEVQYDKPLPLAHKQIATVPFSPLAIPGIVTLGPELTVRGALDLILNGKAELLLGGTMKLGPGVARLSVIDRATNHIDGFKPLFIPVAKFQGANLSATVELGLPIAIEVGLDVLNGLFKKTVSLVNKPSVYGTAAVNSGSACKGVEVSLGAKNRIYVGALDLWDYDIRTDIIFHKDLGCVTLSGFSSPQPEPNVIPTVAKKLGGKDIANLVPKTKAKTVKPPQPANKAGYRVIMDKDKTAILVSGRDGFVYLVSTSDAYDVSAPWGSVNVTANAFSMDVFGRLVSHKTDSHSRLTSTAMVWYPQSIPADYQAGAFALVKEAGKQTYIFAITDNDKVYPYYPTFCKTAQGLRLYPTYYPIDKDGKLQAPADQVDAFAAGFREWGFSNFLQVCNTVSLSAV
ncbi:hypothetical protein F5Y17DRAFT_180805 [Xylariaceae sp. FL0594]|nr:hypothetical protein F5Y17DRAFT_180805 [Xylariaceae sp. FL0594]